MWENGLPGRPNRFEVDLSAIAHNTAIIDAIEQVAHASALIAIIIRAAA